MPPYIAIIVLLLTASATARSQRDDPIAIVGAGPSGISSAYHLVKNGHTNITIYEAENRPGGYLASVRYKNVTHDLSAYGLTALYWKYINFAESLGFSFCPLRSVVIFPASPPEIVNNTAFFASFSTPTLPDPTQYPALLREQIARYTKLWTFLYDVPFLNDRLETDRLFPRKPVDDDKLRRLSMPTLEFLKQENLELLIPIFKLRTDTQAYGPIETTAAVYHMSWNPPSVLLPTANAYVPCDAGFEDIFQATVVRLRRSGKVNFQYGAPVKQVRRGRRFATVITDDGAMDKYSSVIVTAKLENRVRKHIVTPLTPLEIRASRKMEDLEQYTVMLEGSRATSVANGIFLNYLAKPLVESRPNTAFWGATVQENRNPAGPFHSDMSTIVKIGYLFFYREREMRKAVKISISTALRMVLKGMKKLDRTVWTPLQGYRFKQYFQRWRPKQVREGLPWVLEESQGTGNVYYVNSAACGYETVAHVFDCSERVAMKIRNRD